MIFKFQLLNFTEKSIREMQLQTLTFTKNSINLFKELCFKFGIKIPLFRFNINKEDLQRTSEEHNNNADGNLFLRKTTTT